MRQSIYLGVHVPKSIASAATVHDYEREYSHGMLASFVRHGGSSLHVDRRDEPVSMCVFPTSTTFFSESLTSAVSFPDFGTASEILRESQFIQVFVFQNRMPRLPLCTNPKEDAGAECRHVLRWVPTEACVPRTIFWVPTQHQKPPRKTIRLGTHFPELNVSTDTVCDPESEHNIVSTATLHCRRRAVGRWALLYWR